MKTVPFTAYPRTLTRRGGSKKLRENARVPAVIYGGQNKPENLEVERPAFENMLHHAASENVLLELAVDGGSKRLALVKEIQHHPLSGRVLHVDLHQVSENEKVTIMVPVESEGEAVGVKTDGGVLEHVMFKIKVRALPKDLPEVLSVDVSAMKIGDSIHLGDVKPPAGVEIIGEKKLSVFSVAAPITEEQEKALLEGAAEGAATAGEVEMLKEKKEGEEGAEGEAAAPAKGAAGKAAPAAAGAAPAAGAKGAAAAPAKGAAPAAAPAAGAAKKGKK